MNQKLTRIWIWHEPHWLPKASYDKSWDVHPFQWEELFRQLGTGETVSTKIVTVLRFKQKSLQNEK